MTINIPAAIENTNETTVLIETQFKTFASETSETWKRAYVIQNDMGDIEAWIIDVDYWIDKQFATVEKAISFIQNYILKNKV